MGEIVKQTGKEIIEVSTNWLGRELKMTVNKVGFRTAGSVLVQYGDTVILGSAQSGRVNPNLDYFPLSIDYEEKFYASGKISSSRFIKREGRPSDEAILVGRLIDRPIRPLFPKGYKNETQVVSTVLSMDPSFRPDAIAMIAASTALLLTGAPFDGPVAGLRVGLDENGDFATFLNHDDFAKNDMDFFVAGRKLATGENGVMMVEAGMNEIPEEKVADAIDWALENITPALELQNELVAKVGVAKQEFELIEVENSEVFANVKNFLDGEWTNDLRVAYPERNPRVEEIREKMFAKFTEDDENFEENKGEYFAAFDKYNFAKTRDGIKNEGVRPDGRKLDELRPISAEVDILPKEVHGSSLFTRGLTQALNTVTLASVSLSQLVDTMEVTDGTRRYMHHYNAPGYTVGEVRRLGAPGRREIGHGYLAERALIPVLPSLEEFPYAIRSVTEIMSQNGSTSMAATCSSCMALMAAGVPLKKMVSGVAMGLMVDQDEAHNFAKNGNFYILTDLADQEDFAGDMDFKATGTDAGITALQMDMKVHGLPASILREALKNAKIGRDKIREIMETAIKQPRQELSPFAPKVESLQIKVDQIGLVIGKGGETIQKITGETGVVIDIAEDGLVTFATNDAEMMAKAVNWVKSLVEEPEVGKIYRGKVVGIKDFGAFVNILPGTDGMLHISQIADHRIDKVDDVLHMGQEVNVKLTAIDDRGKLSLTMVGIEQ
jgi:polyribonucleotide nucleotidyltransferase